MSTPTAIAQQALDAIGIYHELGDIEDGTEVARVLLRWYKPCFGQLLRGAPWDFARRETELVLLADGTGQTPNVGSVVPGGQFVYEYAYPNDCARLRYIPWNPFSAPAQPPQNIQTPPNVPIVTGLGQPPYVGQRVRPAPFLVTNDPNYPPDPASAGSEGEVQGVSPQGRVVILTNVMQARCVFTTTPLYPSMWDALFREAMVSYLGQAVCLVLYAKKNNEKIGVAIRDRQVELVKQKLIQARVADGNEMWASSDIEVDWMRVRNAGGPRGWGTPYGDSGYGCWGGGWAGSVSFGNGSAY